MVLLVKRKLVVKKIRHLVNRLGRRMAGHKHGNSLTGSHLKKFRLQLVVAGKNNAGDLEPYQIVECLTALPLTEMIQKPGLSITENLYPFVGKEIGKARKRKTGR